MDASVLVEGRTGTVEAPSTVFLIEGARTVLVDTGFGPVDLMSKLHPDYDCHRTADQTLPAVLDDEGYTPADVDAIVLSHLDWDHCYNLAVFPEAEVYVSRRELAYAVDPDPNHADRYEATSSGREPPWLGVDPTPVDGETEICADVTVFPTPGHTVGHQSVAVEGDDGTTVVAADAVPTFDNLTGDPDDPFRVGLAMDDLAWRESAGAVRERADRLLPGHEWAILDADPAGLV